MQGLQRVKEAIPFLTPEAFHYFLPGFMIAILDEPQDAGLAPTSIVGQFTPPPDSADEPRRVYFTERFTRFTPAQRNAIADFLREYARLDLYESGIPKAVQTLVGSEDNK